MHTLRRSLIGITGLLLFAAAAYAAVWDSDHEKLIAEKLSGEIEQGAVVWLKPVFGNAFPAIFNSAGPYARSTAIILLHGMGGHPDWPVVVSPLRQFLQVHHWTTLSIQLPVLKAGRPPADYGKTLRESERRIDSAIEFLGNRQYEQVVLVGYGFGAATAVHAMVKNDKTAVSGVAGISMLARKFLDPDINLPPLLEQIAVPVLDIYAEDDKTVVVDTASDRRLAIRNNGSDRFTQVMLTDTDHYYTGQEHALLEQILAWLENEINSNDDNDN